jgi:hypothetical protein
MMFIIGEEKAKISTGILFASATSYASSMISGGGVAKTRFAERSIIRFNA